LSIAAALYLYTSIPKEKKKEEEEKVQYIFKKSSFYKRKDLIPYYDWLKSMASTMGNTIVGDDIHTPVVVKDKYKWFYKRFHLLPSFGTQYDNLIGNDEIVLFSGDGIFLENDFSRFLMVNGVHHKVDNGITIFDAFRDIEMRGNFEMVLLIYSIKESLNTHDKILEYYKLNHTRTPEQIRLDFI
jgi:5'(3')-deoxyribonucleotidase